MMVFFSHPSERLDRKEREREQLGADREGRERVGEREREIFFRSKKVHHSIYSSCVRRRFFWVRTTKKTKEGRRVFLRSLCSRTKKNKKKEKSNQI